MVAMVLTPGSAFAQTPATGATSAPLPVKSTIKTDMLPSLFVTNARGASLQGQTLTLTGISANSIVFVDRPVRAAGHLLTEHCSKNGAPAVLPRTLRTPRSQC